jgi:hypothetical protein
MPKDKGTVASDNSTPVTMMQKGTLYKRRLEKNTNLKMRIKQKKMDASNAMGQQDHRLESSGDTEEKNAPSAKAI